jgi:2,4-dienoyl-CoA reductase-like NADH-dependent reductase (Old Yellow Enzyme family)
LPATASFHHLLSPLDVGPFELRNRIFSTGHTTAYNADGLVGDQEVALLKDGAGGIA